MIHPALEGLLQEMDGNKYKLVVVAAKQAHRLAKSQIRRVEQPLSTALEDITKGTVEVIEPIE